MSRRDALSTTDIIQQTRCEALRSLPGEQCSLQCCNNCVFIVYSKNSWARQCWTNAVLALISAQEFIASTESLIDAAQQNHSGVKFAHPEWCRTAAMGPIDCRGLKLFFLQHPRGSPVGWRKGERTGRVCVNYFDGKVFVKKATDRI